MIGNVQNNDVNQGEEEEEYLKTVLKNEAKLNESTSCHSASWGSVGNSNGYVHKLCFELK